MIAGGSRDDAPLLLFGRKLRKRVACAAFLKTSGPLQVVELAENFHAGDLAERDGMPTGRVVDSACDPVAGRFDVFEGDHAVQYTARTAAATREIDKY